MEELENLLSGPLDKAIKVLTSQKKDSELIAKYIKEYKNLDRTIRQSQVGIIQKDKQVGKGEKSKTVKVIRSIVPYQEKIVTTATAFEVGAPVTLIPDKVNDLSVEIMRLWEENRMDDKIQKAKVIQKSQTECAFQFYMKKTIDVENKEVLDIKAKILSNEEGTMAPYFDALGDMIAFTWSFSYKNSEDKTIKSTWIWTDKICYKCSDQSGSFVIDEAIPHGFDKIPIVYISQDFPEWHSVESLIDRYETGLSKLGASNDYSGYPLLKLYGKVESMPDRNDDGKTLKFPMKELDNETGKTIHGDADFLTNNNAPESVKLEMDTIDNLIYSLTSTPNLSFDNLKGNIGNLSGVAIKLLFIDSIIKARMNEGDNRTMLQRIIKIFISGVTTTTNTKLASSKKDTIVRIQFNSILPDDLKEAVDIASLAKNAGLMSTRTGVKYLDMTENTEEEIALINADKPIGIVKPDTQELKNN
ncbi:MAG TPA: phage portal protein [Flavobacterium sp.]|jgi:SPP1 family phage portal protein